MPKKCTRCDFYSSENEPQVCPQCGSKVQFTMFAPSGYATAETSTTSNPSSPTTATATSTPAWDVDTAQYEIIELPLSVRLGQIGSGILAFFMLSRFGHKIAFLVFLTGTDESPPLAVLACAMGLTLLIYIAAALFGGAVAGAWSVNWIPQGIGVGVGVLALPLLLIALFVPSWMPIVLYLGLVFITTIFTVVGAYIGHRLIRPSRFILG